MSRSPASVVVNQENIGWAGLILQATISDNLLKPLHNNTFKISTPAYYVGGRSIIG